jgi:hypothetical protein
MIWIIGPTVVAYFAAALWSLYEGNVRMALVWFCYAVANAALTGAK